MVSAVETVTALAVGVGRTVLKPVLPEPGPTTSAGAWASAKSPPACPSCPAWCAESPASSTDSGRW